MAKAEAIGLSADLMEKAKYGSLDITEFDSDTAEKIKDFQNYFEKMKKTSDNILDLTEQIGKPMSRCSTRFKMILRIK